MIHFERWKIWFIVIVVLWGILYSTPNLLSTNMVEKLPKWGPSKTISLGLDLQGGAYLLMQVDMDYVINERMESLKDNARSELGKARIGYIGLKIDGHKIIFKIRNMDDRNKAYKIARNLRQDGMIVDIDDNGLVIVELSPQAITEIKTNALSHSIEIVRKRIDETGTREPVIQRQGYDRILIQLPGVDNPEHIKSLIGKTAKLTFHMVDESSSVSGGRLSPLSMLLPMKENPNQKIAIRKKFVLSGDMLDDAQPSFDQNGQPVVSFRFNGKGAKKFCDITRKNRGKRFAIVLDKEVIMAPVINEPICGGSGIITGRFTVQEVNDFSLLLRAGALPAPLTVVEERTVGPSLGKDSVEAGKIASIVGMAFVLVFMLLVYGLFGIFANIALLVNMALIFALLSVLQATLTLPGIAGIVLTVGMAVDANVLIFERIKEEVRNGRSLYSSVDTGYSQAMSTIVDANLTTLIAALLLFSFGTGPIKGFSVTLGIGIITSMFSAIMLTRLMVVAWLKSKKRKGLPI